MSLEFGVIFSGKQESQLSLTTRHVVMHVAFLWTATFLQCESEKRTSVLRFSNFFHCWIRQ